MIISNNFKFSFKFNSVELYFFIVGSRKYHYIMRKNNLNNKYYYTNLNKFDLKNYRNIFPELSPGNTLNLIINEKYISSDLINESTLYDIVKKFEIDKIFDDVFSNNKTELVTNLNFKFEFINNDNEIILNIENGKLINKKCSNTSLGDIIKIISEIYTIFNKKYNNNLLENKLIDNINSLLVNPLEFNHKLYTKTIFMYRLYKQVIETSFKSKLIDDNIKELTLKYNNI